MKATLLRYKIGLAVIGLFSLVMVVVVVSQASATKQDTETYHKASAIADKLQAYTDSKGEVPASLAAVDIADVPSTVSYHKLSDSSYRFCVTYKATSSSFDATTAVNDTISGYYGTQGSTSENFSGFNGSGSDNYLYVSSSHHKGANCQTIKVDTYSNFGGYGCDYVYGTCDNSSTGTNSFTQ